jgi:hypothetical protein
LRLIWRYAGMTVGRFVMFDVMEAAINELQIVSCD